MTVSVLWLLLKVPWDGLQCVVVVFPDHIYTCFFDPFFSKLNLHEMPNEIHSKIGIRINSMLSITHRVLHFEVVGQYPRINKPLHPK